VRLPRDLPIMRNRIPAVGSVQLVQMVSRRGSEARPSLYLGNLLPRNERAAS